INYAFEKLRKQLQNTYTSRKMSKAVIFQKAILYLNMLLDENNRLNQELEKEK
ncbi:30697_t:CDS:2, partial [Gigaspora margarita]